MQRLPDAEKQARGTLRAHRAPVAASDLLQTLPEPPERLGEHARTHWWRIGRVAVEARVLGRRDLELLTLLAQTMALADAAEADLRERGLVLHSAAGTAKSNPAAAVLRDARSLAARLLAAMALTPASRGSVAAPAASLADLPGAQYIR